MKLEVRAPYDRQPIGVVETSGAEAVEAALDTAYRLFRNRDGWLPPAKRVEILRETARRMAEQAEHLAVEAAREGGKPLVDSRVEVARAIDGVVNASELLRSEAGTVVPMGVTPAALGRIAFTTREPIGVVVAVSAFNHPLNLIVHQVAPAIAAGCPVVVKPAEATPLSCLRFVTILHEAGLPEAWCQALVTESREMTGKLVTDPRVGFFSFIGSAAVGWSLRARLAPGVRCALEHGGAAPVLAAPDADLAMAVPLIAKGGFYHAGQVCVSVQRVFAHRSIVSGFARELAQYASGMRVGDPLLADTEVGPLIRPQEVARVHSWVDEAVGRGAELLCGGHPLSETCYPPTVVLEPPDDCRLSTQEVFGPVVCVYAYDDLDEAIGRANALPYAFQAAVFTRDFATAMHAYTHLDGSAVMVNDHTAFRVDWMPFAGLRQSGLGVGGIPYTFREMQIEKMFVGRLT
ncbi:MAG TPA: aldehyde dehydrogenase family protein [Azospirillum sp.]|nr:aldehyde dehydrogenase family protein [Azospirillum sp.]